MSSAPRTLEEALSRIPKYTILTPDQDNLEPGDARLYDERWELAGSSPNLRIGSLVGTYMTVRRPIPDNVRRALAEMARRAESGTVDYTSTIIVSRWLAGDRQ